MKTILLALAFIAFSVSTFGQENQIDSKPGEVYTINKSNNTPFQHLYFPKTNSIIKSGAIANYKSLNGMQVKIDEIHEDSTVKLSLVNGDRFFNKYYYVKANLKEALQSNELKHIETSKKE